MGPKNDNVTDNTGLSLPTKKNFVKKKKKVENERKKKSDSIGLEPVLPFHRAHANLRLSARFTLSFSLSLVSLSARVAQL